MFALNAHQPVDGINYATVAASQTTQNLTPAVPSGVTQGKGGAGDFLISVVVFPGSTSPGAVTIFDGTTQVAQFPGGASSVSNTVPFPIFINAASVNGAWNITTGSGVTCVCTGQFS